MQRLAWFQAALVARLEAKLPSRMISSADLSVRNYWLSFSLVVIVDNNNSSRRRLAARLIACLPACLHVALTSVVLGAGGASMVLINMTMESTPCICTSICH